MDAQQRQLVLNGKKVGPGGYHGQLEVGVYSTDRLRAVRGSMRDRRLFLDRSAAATWPSYRRLLSDYDRVVRQRSAALEGRRNGLEAWDEQLVELGARLRARRESYVSQLQQQLSEEPLMAGEEYAVSLSNVAGDESAHRELLYEQVRQVREKERAAGRTLVGPHRDRLRLTVSDHEIAEGASSGQSRSLFLALTLATLEVYRSVRGGRPVALLDDLDSELDDERATRLCEQLSRRWQLLVTTAHESWARSVGELGCRFRVRDGDVCHT
jgi:DNA replication and repair protein RecF